MTAVDDHTEPLFVSCECCTQPLGDPTPDRYCPLCRAVLGDHDPDWGLAPLTVRKAAKMAWAVVDVLRGGEQ